MKMEVVEKKAPINDENNKRKAGYYICDNLTLFYYRYNVDQDELEVEEDETDSKEN